MSRVLRGLREYSNEKEQVVLAGKDGGNPRHKEYRQRGEGQRYNDIPKFLQPRRTIQHRRFHHFGGNVKHLVGVH